MAKSSIHVAPIKANSEAHNQRESELDYVVSERMKDNESFVLESVADRLKEIKRSCRQISGRKLQKNAIPIREAVVNLNENHTIADIKRLSSAINEKFGVEVFQAYIHRDEGHNDPIDGRFIVNHHAHLVFDWQDKETGKMRRLNRSDMSQMQDLVADVLNMERGELKENSNRERLEAMEYKTQKEKELAELYKRDAAEHYAQLQETQEEQKKLQQEIEDIKQKKSASVNELKHLEAELRTIEQETIEEPQKELETPLKRPKTTLMGGLMNLIKSKTSQTMQLVSQYLKSVGILKTLKQKNKDLQKSLNDLQNELKQTSKSSEYATESKNFGELLKEISGQLTNLKPSSNITKNSQKGRDLGMGM